MIVKNIIKGNPVGKREIPVHNDFSTEILEIAEFFYDTIQGEGINLGHPAAFLRMQHCTQNCIWCDTQEVWRFGNPYHIREILSMMEKTGLVERFKKGQHLVLTGGSPLRQQPALISLISSFTDKHGFKPYIEIENECTIDPLPKMIEYVDCWNNSPKLGHSGNLDILRYQPKILKKLSALQNSWFKFVVSKYSDWQEIQKDFLNSNLIKKDQIILMPLGADRKELYRNMERTVELAISEDIKYCSREHITLWDKKTGV